MPQRRAFAPTPINRADIGHTGRAGAPPNLAPGAQPLPPSASPAGGGSPMALSPLGASAPRPPLPSSMPLSPMAPMGASGAGGPGAGGMPPQLRLQGTGTVDPFDVHPFLEAQQNGSAFGGVDQGDAGFHLPHESTTTAADLQGDDGEGGMPSMLLRLLGAMGGR